MHFSLQKLESHDERRNAPFQIVRPDVMQYCPRLINPMPSNPYSFYPQYLMEIPSYQIQSQPAHFYHPNRQLVVVPQLPYFSPSQRFSPPAATPATYGNQMCLIPPEAASIGSQRPFKVLTSPRANPLPLIGSLDPSTEAAYEQFKNQMITCLSSTSGQNNRNRNMSRNVTANPEKLNDPEYLEKRRKNNEAAKKSRDARKLKEDEMAIRVAFLEKEVYQLMVRLAMLQKEKRNRMEAIKRPRLMPITQY